MTTPGGGCWTRGRDGRTFRWRVFDGGAYQVTDASLLLVCRCESEEMARMVAGALEKEARRERGES